MRLKLTRLVWITCIALLGIVALQVFWLFKSYEEQKEKLFAVVGTSMMETQIFTGVNASLNTSVQSLAEDMIQEQLKTRDKVKDTVLIVVPKHYTIDIQPETLPVQHKDELASELLKMVGIDSSRHRNYTIKEYKAKIEQSLQAKNVTIPFELALVDPNGAILSCTTDTASFQQTGMKSDILFSLPVTLGPRLSGKAQLAFPGGGFYLLRGMWVILLLSLCLITICGISFSYMVALFYKQKKIAEVRNDFMNNMTHELKTPISSVSVALQLLQDNSVTVDEHVRQEYFQIAGNELNRLTQLVDKVLRMAAFEKMQVKINKEWFTVSDWIEEVLHAIRPLTEAGNANVDVVVTPVTLRYFADRDQMNSILQNLLENAIRYADKNKPAPLIGIEAGEDGDWFYLKIADNGIGIEEQYLSRIFDKFFRVPTGDEHETKGYGLGLSYVKEIVRLHKGEIKVTSAVKEGTTFTIIIPKNG